MTIHANDMLQLVSLQAPNADPFYEGLAAYLSTRVSEDVLAAHDHPWWERERLFDSGQAHLAVMCGTYYVARADEGYGEVELLAAPVMAGRRYGDRPVYYSDIVVHMDSPFGSLAELEGHSWAYNEPRSHSGYNVVRHTLAKMGCASGFFSRTVCSGSHEASLQLILDGKVDGAAIDSTVLDREVLLRPELASQVRVLESFGPSPIPPLVARKDLPDARLDELREALLTMHQVEEGAALLAAFGLVRFSAVQDGDYDGIRCMTESGRCSRLVH